MILEQLVIQADEKHCMAVRSLSIESATCLIITSARRRETWQKSNLMVFASTILHACNTQHGGGAGPNTGKDDTLHAVALFLLCVHDALQRAQHACDELRALAARRHSGGLFQLGLPAGPWGPRRSLRSRHRSRFFVATRRRLRGAEPWGADAGALPSAARWLRRVRGRRSPPRRADFAAFAPCLPSPAPWPRAGGLVRLFSPAGRGTGEGAGEAFQGVRCFGGRRCR